MFEDLRNVIRDLGQMKLDHMLEEIKNMKEPIPESFNDDDDFNMTAKSSEMERFSDTKSKNSWYNSKDWKTLTVQTLQKRNMKNRLQKATTWIQDGKVDSRDFYDCIPHVSVQKIISDLDKESSVGSIEELIRKQSTDENDGKKTKESAKVQLQKLLACLKKVEMETVAIIAAFTKKIKQMIFFYLTDFMSGPVHLDESGQPMSEKEYIVAVFNDLIQRIKRKAVYVCDSDMDIGKAQLCFYFIKFYKNKEVKRTVEFMEQKLSQLLNFETYANDTKLSEGSSNIFIEMVLKIPKEKILKGKKLFEVINIIHQGVDNELERVKEMKKKLEVAKRANSITKESILQADHEHLIKGSLSNHQSTYPCIRLQEIYTNAVLKIWPDFDSEVLVQNGITFHEYVNMCRYFGCYNFPEDQV